MITRDVLEDWVLEALHAMGGTGSPASVAKEMWKRHSQELMEAGDLFYTWQYDMRWAAQRLRDEGKLRKARSRSAPWEVV